LLFFLFLSLYYGENGRSVAGVEMVEEGPPFLTSWKPRRTKIGLIEWQIEFTNKNVENTHTNKKYNLIKCYVVRVWWDHHFACQGANHAENSAEEETKKVLLA
jgi:hypothetical protein